VPVSSTTPLFTDWTEIRLSWRAGSACNAFSIRALRASSATCTAWTCCGATTCSRLRTPCTPSIFCATRSACAFSPAEGTLPCKVTRPRTVSTWMAVPLTPSVVRRASLAFVVIQASGVAAPTGAASAAPSPTASTPNLSHDVPFMIFLLCLDRGVISVCAPGDRVIAAPLCSRSPPRAASPRSGPPST
jgi:hypothetical protein